jgi:hypothetical protein
MLFTSECSQCHQSLPADAFPRNRRTCRPCLAALARARRLRARIAEYNHEMWVGMHGTDPMGYVHSIDGHLVDLSRSQHLRLLRDWRLDPRSGVWSRTCPVCRAHKPIDCYYASQRHSGACKACRCAKRTTPTN